MAEDNLTNTDNLKLLTRARLIQRWQHGSNPFFWRAEQAGRLVPLRSDGLVRYAWPDVFAFEGGLPPQDMEVAYRQDLLTEEQVSTFCSCGVGKIFAKAASGDLAARRIGRALRFVPAEVARWQATGWSRGRR